MAEVRKIGEEYFVEYYAQGLLFRKIGGKTLEEAQQVLKKIEDSLPDQHHWYKTREDPFNDVFTNFLKLVESEYSPITYARFDAVTQDFKRFLSLNFPQYKLISHITPIVISRYVSYLSAELNLKNDRKKSRYINFSLLLLSEIFSQAINWGAVNDNPVLHIKPFGRQYLSRSSRVAIDIDFSSLNSDDLQKKNLAPNVKKQLARHLIERGVRLIQILKWLGISDIGRFCYFGETVFGCFEKKIS